MFVNGKRIETEAYIENGVTYVPLRAISEGLNANVEWNGETAQIDITGTATGEPYTYAVNKIAPSTVAIIGSFPGETTATYEDKYAEGIAHGTGIIITSGGEILTNAHVVKDMTNMIVILPNGEGYNATLKYIDDEMDLAVVKIDKLGLPAAVFAEDGAITPGAQVVAVGTPLSMALRNSVSAGIISGINRSVSSDYKLIQTDAAINPGNSGGPLVNMAGQVVGVCSSGFSGIGIESLNIAIPVSDVRYAINQFNTYGKINRPYFNADFTESIAAKYGLPGNYGLKISNVTLGGAAANAGIQNGDTLISVDGIPVNTKADWNEVSKSYIPGSRATVKCKRGDTVYEIQIVFGQKI